MDKHKQEKFQLNYRVGPLLTAGLLNSFESGGPESFPDFSDRDFNEIITTEDSTEDIVAKANSKLKP